MTYTRFFIVVVILFTLAGEQVFGAIDCAEFKVYTMGSPDDKYCGYERQLPWVAYGGTWGSTFRWSNTKVDNTKPGGVTVVVTILGTDGKWTTKDPYIRDNRAPSVVVSPSIYYPLMPGESVEMELMYPGLLENKQWSPDPGTLAVGSILVLYTALDPEYLRGLPPSSLSFLEKDSSGGFLRNATEIETEPSEYWKAQFSETFDCSANWQTARRTSAAISNPTSVPIFVDITLNNQRGEFVATLGYYLQPLETKAFLFRDIFGDRMFPGGKDFTGTVTLSRREWSVLNPGSYQGTNFTIFQTVSGSMGNLPATRVMRP